MVLVSFELIFEKEIDLNWKWNEKKTTQSENDALESKIRKESTCLSADDV